MRHFSLAACAALALLSACSSSHKASSGCRLTSDCASGAVCIDSVCAVLCSAAGDCSTGFACSAAGLCVASSSDLLPRLSELRGDDPADSTRIAGGLVLVGENLAQASLELRGAGAPMPLTVASSSATQMTASLPIDIVSGDYVLVVTNAAGSIQQAVTLTLPELTGTDLLARLNGATVVGTLSVLRLPIGTTSSSVSAGNHTHSNYALAGEAIDITRLPVGLAASDVAAGNHTHPPVLNNGAAPLTSCQAIVDAGGNEGDGVYRIDPNGGDPADAFAVHCEMTTLTGGWTLVMNVEPADGNSVSFTNTVFWQDNAEWGQFENHFTKDYKSPAAWLMSGTSIMVQVANPGPEGRVIGWKAWSMAAKSFDVFFDAADNTVQTSVVLGADVAAVYAYEPLIKNGTHLRSNLNINVNADRVRLGVDAYALQGDDNEPGLGTRMNSTSNPCGAATAGGCYRYRDVELWVNSATNLWNALPGPGSFKWIGTDGGCGGSCGTADTVAGPGYSPYWTYRIYVR